MNRPRLLRAAANTGALSLIFLAVYGGCNALTGLRPDVGTCAFEWERAIPFWPAMIVPYLSIDVFFVLAPFVCNDAERRLLTRRIAMAILVAGAVFLLFPLRFAFERPPAAGMLGAVFEWFRAMDAPYNLAPSLHIALRTLLVGVYARRARGGWRVATHVWFSLIGLSTLLVWQHHLVDVAAGFILAAYCFLVFPERPAGAAAVRPNRRVGCGYALGAILLGVAGSLLRPWGALLLWPALALGVLAAANFRCGVAVFRKRDGRLPLATRLLLAPVLLGQRLSWLHYRRHCRPWDEVTPHVWIGRLLTAREAEGAVARGVTAVLDLTGEFSAPAAFRACRYRNIPVLDLTAPDIDALHAMAGFITTESARGVVYVHCKIGYSRSAAAVAAWLLLSGAATTVDEALARLQRIRPSIVVRPEIRAVLGELVATMPRPGRKVVSAAANRPRGCRPPPLRGCRTPR